MGHQFSKKWLEKQSVPAVAHDVMAKNRIKHHIATKKTSTSELLIENFNLTATQAHSLIKIGAIYINKERTLEDITISPEDYLRIHLNPKRYKWNEVKWDQAIVHETEDFVVLNKPCGMPIHPMLDNAKENLLYELRNHFDSDFFVTHRIDVETKGLVVVAKTKEFQSYFFELLKNSDVQKYYTAYSHKKIKNGTYVHFMEKSDRAPKVICEKQSKDNLSCELRVLNVEELEFRNFPIYEHSVELVTGRTHQIRAQFQFLKAPLINDKMYGGRRITRFPLKNGLISKKIRFPKSESSVDFWEFELDSKLRDL